MLVTCPQAPEIIAVGNSCAFRWNTEKVIFAILKREKLPCNRRTFCIAVFCFSRLSDVSHKFCNISLWAAVITGPLHFSTSFLLYLDSGVRNYHASSFFFFFCIHSQKNTPISAAAPTMPAAMATAPIRLPWAASSLIGKSARGTFSSSRS